MPAVLLACWCPPCRRVRCALPPSALRAPCAPRPCAQCVYFVNSGSEANDLAMIMARMHTRNWDLITLRNAYHGMSIGTMGTCGQHTWKQAMPQVSGAGRAGASCVQYVGSRAGICTTSSCALEQHECTQSRRLYAHTRTHARDTGLWHPSCTQP